MNTTQASDRVRRAKRDISEQEFSRILTIASRLTILFAGAILAIFVLKVGQAILVPVGLAIIIGLVFGPVADRLEARGIPPGLSAGIIMLAFLAVLASGIVLFAVPLAEWGARLPLIWQRLQTEILNWREQLEVISSLQERLDEMLGNEGTVQVQVEEGNQVIDMALLAPAVLGDVLIFLASLYFYLATRENIRVSILSMIVSRKLRWRAAHVFGGIESNVSRFLLSVTVLNVAVGIAVTAIAFAFGMPSPLLWGVIAAILNYVPYLGQAVMIGILLIVGFATQTELAMILLPVVCYMLVNLVEGQFAFPMFVGKIMTLNPFLIFFSIIFWIWLWGPIGSLVAVPSLIILQALASSLIPAQEIAPRRPVRRTPGMTEKDVILENAARAIREASAKRREQPAK